MKNTIKLIAMATASIALVQVSQAATISINDIAPDDGTFSSFTSVASTDGNSFTLSRIFDFDEGGTDDTLTFTLTRTTYSGATINGSDIIVGNVNNGGNNVNWYSNFGNADSLQLAVSGISYTSGEADGTTVVFDGFQGISRNNFTNAAGLGAGTTELDFHVHTGSVGSTIITNSGGFQDLTSAGNSTNVFFTAEAGSLGIRLREVDLQFSTVAVPEPSSAVLLGIGGLALILRRRK